MHAGLHVKCPVIFRPILTKIRKCCQTPNINFPSNSFSMGVVSSLAGCRVGGRGWGITKLIVASLSIFPTAPTNYAHCNLSKIWMYNGTNEICNTSYSKNSCSLCTMHFLCKSYGFWTYEQELLCLRTFCALCVQQSPVSFRIHSKVIYICIFSIAVNKGEKKSL